MNKAAKQMYKALEDMCGEHDAGLLLAIMCDAIVNFAKGSEVGREARTVEVKFNDFFSLKYNFETKKYTTNGIEEGEENEPSAVATL